MTKFQVGDRVRVRKPKTGRWPLLWLSDMDQFDETVQKISQVLEEDSGYIIRLAGVRPEWGFHSDWLEPVEPKTLNVGEPVKPIQSWVPEGYSVVEMAVPDEMANDIGEGNALVWRKPVIGERFCGEEVTETSTRDYAHYYYPVIVPTTPPAPQYREPTAADVGRTVDVRDREKEPWQDRELLAVIGDKTIVRRFVCRDVAGGVHCFHWTFAQIKIEESK